MFIEMRYQPDFSPITLKCPSDQLRKRSIMDIRSTLDDSFAYAKESVWGKWKRWVLLTLMSAIFPFILGYIMEIYRGTAPSPEPENWKKLFVDGLKVLVAAIMYAIPVFVILIASCLPLFVGIIGKVSSGTKFSFSFAELLSYILPVLGGLVLACIVAIIISLVSTIGLIRMARTESFIEAFNFPAIFETISTIGWASYILALIVLWIIAMVISIPLGCIETVPFVGWLPGLILGVPLIVFEARYMSLVYDVAET